MPDNIMICGRIPYPVVWDYFKQLHKANNTDLIVLRFHVVNEEDKQNYISLFQYFHSRQRIGVVGNNKKHIKDMYILPLSAHEPVPREVLPFKGPGKFCANLQAGLKFFILLLTTNQTSQMEFKH